MPESERVVTNLNRALGALLDKDQRVYVLGEDIGDPYGGAFKVTRGLSTRFPGRVLSTPISESAIAGVAGGLALAGDRPVIEVMFGDFAGLCFDQLYNFAAKSVSMYGHRVPMPMIVRCPVGGNRGYGPTHSQNPQKHFIGIPNLSLWELSPLHDNAVVLDRIMDRGEPAILFEDKTLYSRRMHRDGVISGPLRFDFPGGDGNWARVYVGRPDPADYVIIAPGGLAERAWQAAADLLVEHELTGQVLVPSRLYPVDLEPLLPAVRDAGLICIAEEGVTGGTWGAEVANQLYGRLWADLKRPIRLVSSADSVIPTAPHLEREVLVQSETIYRAVCEALDA
ncbi:MAG TPA: transketolase C-terminal domain-containing protein [Streptosporangiaceae bacterium]|jgi:pyruvate dehydrogenase E1 component beta subunit